MTMALRSKNMLHFFIGALPRPPDENRDSIAWDRSNSMIVMVNIFVDYEISQSILWMEIASSLWKARKE